MPLHNHVRLLVVFGLALAPIACSEPGPLSTSPVTPSSLSDPAPAAAGSLATTAATPSAKPGGGATGFKVTSLVAGVGVALGQIQSDDGTAYVHSKTLTSEVQPVGDWVLDTINPRGATRMLAFDFSAPVSGTVPSGTPEDGEYKFRLMAQCAAPLISDGSSNSLTGSWTLGQSRLCPMRIAFDVGTDVGIVRYVLLMNKNFQTVNGPFLSTDNVTVTCTVGSSTSCSKWSLTSSGANVAKLYQTNSSGSLTTEVGDFYLSFSMEIAK